MAKKVFGWLACAKRPLNWYEIQAALSIQISNGEHPLDMDFYGCVLRDDPRELCGSLGADMGKTEGRAGAEAQVDMRRPRGRAEGGGFGGFGAGQLGRGIGGSRANGRHFIDYLS